MLGERKENEPHDRSHQRRTNKDGSRMSVIVCADIHHREKGKVKISMPKLNNLGSSRHIAMERMGQRNSVVRVCHLS